MMYAVFFEDNETFATMRAKHMNEHLAFLNDHKGIVLAAGPLTNTADELSAGGLWVVNADTHQAVQDLVEMDPFFPTGLRKSIKILQWNQVFTSE